MSGTLEIFTLGGVRFALDGEAFSKLRSRKVAALLIYLAHAGRAVPREMLAELLWSDLTQERAAANLRVALHDLRRHFGPHMAIDRLDASLDPDADIVYDARELLEALDSGQGNVAALRRAVDAYRGEFLAGFFLRDGREFDLWATVEREAIQQKVLDAYRTVGSSDLRQHAFREGIPFVRRWLQLDPLSEEGHRILMQMLAADGRQAQSLAQYEQLAALLEEELGLEPGGETQELRQQIAAGQWSPPAAEYASVALINLPAEQTPLVGRQKELALLDALLSDPAVRLVTLNGAGGTGKTRLALAAGRRHVEDETFRDGIVFVSMAALESAAQMTAAIAAGLGLNLTDERGQLDQLQTFLRSRSMLLILDNLEQVKDAPLYIADLLRAVPWITVLATSRAKLALQAEHVINLRGLPFESADGSAILQTDAAQLFLGAARRTTSDFQLLPQDEQAIAEICRLVEGLPLALELTAGRVDVISTAEIASEIRESYRILETDKHDVPERHRSMEAAFESSWTSLSAREQELLAALSVFRGGWTRAAVEAVADAKLGELTSLAAKNLMRFDRAADRYEMHELLRQFAGRKLVERRSQARRVHERHSHFYCSLLGSQQKMLVGPYQHQTLDMLEREAENVRRAWLEACAHPFLNHLEQAADVLGIFYLWRNHYGSGSEAFEAAAGAVRGDMGRAENAQGLAAEMLIWDGVFAQRRQRWELAARRYAEGLELADLGKVESDRATRVKARGQARLGSLLWEQGRYAEAESALKEALASFEALSDSWGAAGVLAGLGDVANSRGAYPPALDYYGRSLQTFRTLGDGRNTARVLQRMSYAARDLGQMREAERFTGEALKILENGNDREQLAHAYLALGWLLIYQGRLDEALGAVQRSTAQFQELGLPAPINVLSIVHQELGHYDIARGLLENNIAACRARGDEVELAFALSIMSVIAILDDRPADACTMLEEAIHLLAAGGQQDRLGAAYAHRGHAELRSGNKGAAAADFRSSMEMALQIQSLIPLLFAVPGAALLLAEEGRVEEALRIYAPLARMPLVSNSQMRADLAGKRLAELAGLSAAGLADVDAAANWSPWDAARAALDCL